MKKYSVDDLKRLAFVWAEENVREFAAANPDGSQERSDALDLAKQLHAYRMKKWGKTGFEVAVENSQTVSIYEILNRPSSSANE